MKATVLINTDDCTGEYPMFDLQSLDGNGAVLEGPLFLEIGETLVLRIDKENASIEIAAKVAEVSEDKATMAVRFVEKDPKLDAFLKAK